MVLCIGANEHQAIEMERFSAANHLGESGWDQHGSGQVARNDLTPASCIDQRYLQEVTKGVELKRFRFRRRHMNPTKSHAWEGEDILVRKIMRDVFGVESGFYVDVGAHHPFNLSNTALLYSEGWRGINIEATPGSIKAFDRYRPLDTNLEVAVAPQAGPLKFTRFDDPGLNGFVSDEIIEAHRARGIGVVEQLMMECVQLNDLLAAHAKDKAIDMMNIDVEGLDFEILSTLDMVNWRPRLIVAEVLGSRFVQDIQETDIHHLMTERGYALFSRLHFSCIFVDRDACP